MSPYIVELQVSNLKRLKAVQIFPKGSTVTISGKNDQGKTSVLDAVEYAFRGKGICAEPIRTGEKRANVFIKLSEELEGIATIERKFTPSGSTIEIKNADGIIQKTPQALLDAVIAKIAFDPLSFVRMKPAEQLELLRKLVGLDFTELNKARQLAFDERTIRNRELESAKVRLAAHPFNASAPEKELTATHLIEELSKAQRHNQSITAKRSEIQSKGNAYRDIEHSKEQIKKEIEALEKMLADKRTQLTIKVTESENLFTECQRLESEFKAMVPADETKAQKAIEEIQQTNSLVEANRQHVKAREDVELLEGTVRGLNDKIKECDEQKSAQIEFATFPMPGLSFDEERGVLLNNVPFQQGSQARQLQAAVAIGLALNPKIKIILIRDGSLMDDDSMKLVAEMAQQNGAQFWIEVVNSKDPAAIVIEDGEVK